MNVHMLSEREVRIVDSVHSIDECLMMDIDQSKDATLVLLVRLKGKEYYSVVSATGSVVKEFRQFNTLYSFIRKNCSNYLKRQIQNELPVLSMRVSTSEMVLNSEDEVDVVI